jgi:DNA-binding transcriptional ArsR family regulator
MSDADAPVEAERTAEEAFEAVADETRLSVLRALMEAEDPLSFSELRDQTGVEDSGRFNYHLNALRDGFVRQTEEGGYTLTHAGHTIVGAVLAGRLTAAGDVEPRAVETGCLDCGGPLEAHYEEALFVVECEDCGQTLTRYHVPPAVLEHHSADYPRAAWQYIFSRAALMRAGFCHVCEGPIHEQIAEPGGSFPEGETVAVEWRCDRCGTQMRSSLLAALVDEPPVRAFLADMGIDPAKDPPWDEGWLYADAETVVVEEEDPRLVEATITFDEESLELTLDEHVNLIEANRTSGS